MGHYFWGKTIFIRGIVRHVRQCHQIRIRRYGVLLEFGGETVGIGIGATDRNVRERQGHEERAVVDSSGAYRGRPGISAGRSHVSIGGTGAVRTNGPPHARRHDAQPAFAQREIAIVQPTGSFGLRHRRRQGRCRGRLDRRMFHEVLDARCRRQIGELSSVRSGPLHHVALLVAAVQCRRRFYNAIVDHLLLHVFFFWPNQLTHSHRLVLYCSLSSVVVVLVVVL